MLVEEHDRRCSRTARRRISPMSDALKGNPEQSDARAAPWRSSERLAKAAGKSGHGNAKRPRSILKEAGKLHCRVSFFSSTPSKTRYKYRARFIPSPPPPRGYNLVTATGSFSSAAQRKRKFLKSPNIPLLCISKRLPHCT